MRAARRLTQPGVLGVDPSPVASKVTNRSLLALLLLPSNGSQVFTETPHLRSGDPDDVRE